jgi:hypothetical protein
MGCCSSKDKGSGDKAEPAAVVAVAKREAAPKTAQPDNDVGKQGVDNRGFEQKGEEKLPELQSPTITITTAEEVNAQFEAAEMRRKEEVKRREEEARQLKEAAGTKAQSKGDSMSKTLSSDAGKRDEVDGIPAEARRESAAGVSNRGNRHMETIGEEEEEEEGESSPAPPPVEEPPPRAVSQTNNEAKQHATLAPTKSNPTSRRISQIAPASVDSPGAVKVSNKFVMIPTAGPDTIAEED